MGIENPIDDAVREEGRIDGQDFLMRPNNTLSVARAILKEDRLNLDDFPAVLPCENWFTHTDEVILQLPTSRHLKFAKFRHVDRIFSRLSISSLLAYSDARNATVK
jgi:hypothetical protein